MFSILPRFVHGVPGDVGVRAHRWVSLFRGANPRFQPAAFSGWFLGFHPIFWLTTHVPSLSANRDFSSGFNWS